MWLHRKRQRLSVPKEAAVGERILIIMTSQVGVCVCVLCKHAHVLLQLFFFSLIAVLMLSQYCWTAELSIV